MDRLVRWLSSEALDAEVISGVSYGFAMIFFVPLIAVAAIFLVYCLFAKGSVLRIAKTLSLLWLVACVPAVLMIVMGFAFNSYKLTPLVSVPLWITAGLLTLWLPIAVRFLLGLRPL